MGLLDVFCISGRIAVEYSEAVRDIEAVSTAADNAADDIGGLGDEARRTQEPVDELGEETEETGRQTEDTDGKFTVWKATLANLASDAIKKAISKIGELAKEIVGLGEDFSATMSEVKAISGASDEEFEALKSTAREFGSSTVFSATEAAEALKYMALAGWDTEQSTAALGGVLDLAAASGMELGQASDMVTDYLSAFGMEADKSAYFADVLAYAQANSNTTAAQLGDAYGNCAASLNAAGQDVETVTALLEAMANQGLKGSEGGTALSATMRDITNAMVRVKDKTDLAQLAQSEFTSSTGDLNDLLGKNYIQMGKTLIPVSDAKGNFRDLTDILTDVSEATNGMGDAERAAALSNTFTAYSIKGVNLVLNEGIDKVAGYEEKLRGADGAAADMAATMNDNLKGDLAGMNSALDELKLKIFDGLEEPLRSAVQFITGKVVPALTALLQNFESLLPGIAALTTAIVTFKTVMAISGLINGITAAWTAYKTANEGATVAQWLFNAAVGANPLVLLISLLAGLIVMFVVLWNKCDWFREFWIDLWEKISDAVYNACCRYTDFIFGLGESLNELVDSIIEFWVNINLKVIEAFEKIKEVLGLAWEALQDFVNDIILFWAGFLFGIIQNTKSMWERIKKFIKCIPDGFRKGVIEPISMFFLVLWTSITQKAKSVWDNVKKAFSGVKKFFGDMWDGIKEKFTSIGTKIGDAIGGAFKSTVNAVIATVEKSINFIPDAINGALDLINKLPNVDIPMIPTIELPRLAKGGVAEHRTIAEIGENGSEAVVPLEHNTEWTGRVANLISSQLPQRDDTIADKLSQIVDILKSKSGVDSSINLTINIENLNGDKTDVEKLVKLIMPLLYQEIYKKKAVY